MQTNNGEFIFNYGQLHYDFLTKNSSKVITGRINENIPDISQESQRVYSLLPSNHVYDNDDKQCKQLCIISTELFLESDALIEYATSFSSILKTLISDKHKILPIIREDVTQTILAKYSENSKFIRGRDISNEILKYAIGLENMQKASLIFVIGGHAVNVNVFSKDNYLTFIYYNPSQGQLYKQTVIKSEIEKVLEGKNYFVHPLSILNDHSVLPGQISILEDTILDTNATFVLRTAITKTENNAPNHKIDIASNIDRTELIKYLAQMPAIFDIMLYITKKSAFDKFIGQHTKKIIAEMDNVELCVDEVSKCSDYLVTILTGFYHDDLRHDVLGNVRYDIRNLYKNYNYFKHKLKTFPSVSNNNGKLCVKEVKTHSEQPKAVKSFYKILFEDKIALNKALQNCFKQDTLKEKKKVAKELCEGFSEVDPNDFTAAHKAYYDYIDSRYKKNPQEQCHDLESLDEHLVPSLQHTHIEL